MAVLMTYGRLRECKRFVTARKSCNLLMCHRYFFMYSNETHMETRTKIRNSLTFEFSCFRAVARTRTSHTPPYRSLLALPYDRERGALDRNADYSHLGRQATVPRLCRVFAGLPSLPNAFWWGGVAHHLLYQSNFFSRSLAPCCLGIGREPEGRIGAQEKHAHFFLGPV